MGDADAVRVLLDRHVRHAAEHIARLILMREEIAERPEDRYASPILGCDRGERLHEMRVPADDEIGSMVSQELRPRGLHLIRLGLALLAPVGEDDDKVSGSLCSVEIGGDRVEGRELVDHPFLLRRGIVQAVGVVQHCDFDVVFLHDAERICIVLAVVDAKDGDVRIILTPKRTRVENAGVQLVVTVVRRAGDDVEARLGQRVADLCRAAEAG